MELHSGYTYHRLDAVWLASYIRVMERIYYEKPQHTTYYSDQIQWLPHEIPIKLWAREEWVFGIAFSVPNKYRCHWDLATVIEEAEKRGFYDPDRHGTDESFGGVTLFVEPECLYTYIEELIAEYERETGETYERYMGK